MLYNDMIKKDFSHTTIRLVSATLSGCFKQAMKNGLIERNPVPLATLSKAKPKESHRVLTKKEQDIFMEYAKGSYLHNLFVLAIKDRVKRRGVAGIKAFGCG